MASRATLPSPAERSTLLAASRRRKMAASAHAYVRGNVGGFYRWLAASPAARPAGPPVWICGDCHLGNLGPVADRAGRVAIGVCDVDETVVGDPGHDLVRLGLSLAMAAREARLPGGGTIHALEALVAGARAALVDPARRPPEAALVRQVRRRAAGRRWRDLARDRLDGGDRLPPGRRFWPLAEQEAAALAALVADPATLAALIAPERLAGRAVRLVDAAYWIKGCGSLGLARYAVLLELAGPHGRIDHALVDVKEATAPAAPPIGRHAPGPADRVVAGARALVPALGERMAAATLLDRPMVLRELMPQDGKLELGRVSAAQLAQVAHTAGGVIGQAHGRQLDDADRRAWRDLLGHDHRGAVAAPAWLWRDVVALTATHEADYLDHCRHARAG